MCSKKSLWKYIKPSSKSRNPPTSSSRQPSNVAAPKAVPTIPAKPDSTPVSQQTLDATSASQSISPETSGHNSPLSVSGSTPSNTIESNITDPQNRESLHPNLQAATSSSGLTQPEPAATIVPSRSSEQLLSADQGRVSRDGGESDAPPASQDVPTDSEEFGSDSSNEPALAALKVAVREFVKHYTILGNHLNQKFHIQKNVQDAIETAAKEGDIKRSAQLFRKQITEVLDPDNKNQKQKGNYWGGRIANFASKLYPLTRFTLQLTAIASGAASFNPLKGASEGLVFILDAIHSESQRASEFYEHLCRIEYQAARLGENPHFNLTEISTTNLMREKSIDLMTAIIRFFDAALLYFRSDVFDKLLNIVTQTNTYGKGKEMLERAIAEYDQAVFDFTSSIATNTVAMLTEMASTLTNLQLDQDATRKHHEETQMKRQEEQRKKENEEFMHWLSPSHQAVASQLLVFRKQRGMGTLRWAMEMPEFHRWRTSDPNSPNRILWIDGILGVGKSTMAAYLIDLLRFSTPAPSVVAFFFCRSGIPGLMTARDIIRTYAYQCFHDNPDAHEELKKLRQLNYRTDDTVPICSLFESLIANPLRHVRHDIYLVLDGVDESDTQAKDQYGDRVLKSEMEVLIDCLANLPSARILFISRPTSVISETIPSSKMIHRRLVGADNKSDINSYVRKTINESSTLHRYFESLQVDPHEYFDKNANGIFLWVVIFLQQLKNAGSKKAFKECFNRFKKVGAMEINELYKTMFSKVKKSDKDFVREILRWLVYGNFAVSTLRGAVEWCLDDIKLDFEEFLQIGCGSMLLSVDAEDDTDVQLIHETFRSFVTDPAQGKEFYFVDQKNLKRDAFVACLGVISSGESLTNERLKPFRDYASRSWVKQLKDITEEGVFPNGALNNLYNFFESGSCKVWVRESFARMQIGLGFNENLENLLEEAPYYVYNFLVRWKEERQKPQNTLMAENNDAVKWGMEMLNFPSKLGDYIGKASADLWLYEKLSPDKLDVARRVSWRYYCISHQRKIYSMTELKAVAANGFAGLRTWSGKSTGQNPTHRFLATQFALLGMWKEAKDFFARSMEEDQDHNENILEGFVLACLEAGDAVSVIDTLKTRLSKESKPKWHMYYALACNIIRDTESALVHFEQAAELLVGQRRILSLLRFVPASLEWITLQLVQLQAAREDWHGAIAVCERLLDIKSSAWWAWKCLEDVYITTLNMETAEKVCQRVREGNWSCSRSMQKLEQKPKSILTDNSSAEPTERESVTKDSHRIQFTSVQFEINESSPHSEAGVRDWAVIRNPDASTQVEVSLRYEWEVLSEHSTILFSDKGEYVAVACPISRTVHLYCLKSGQEIGTYIHYHDDTLLSSDSKGCLSIPIRVEGLAMCFSPDAQYLITSAVDSIIRIWDIKTGVVKQGFKGQTGYIWSLSVSADGKYLASGSSTKLQLWDLKATDSTAREVDLPKIEKGLLEFSILSFSPDSKLLACTGHIGDIYLLDTETWRVVTKLETAVFGFSRRLRLKFSASGCQLTLVTDFCVRQWNFQDPKESNDGSTAIVGWSAEPSSFQCDSQMIPGKGFGYDSNTNWTVLSNNHTVVLYDLREREPLFTLTNNNKPLELDSWIGPDTEMMFATGGRDSPFGNSRVRIWSCRPL